ncbi:glycosyltransferase, partial [Macrococcoides canis]|uniref:glycosyltransferase n=1 Tax=Macrococcoides canis TaxID=1855823 RepID=UPI00105DF49B
KIYYEASALNLPIEFIGKKSINELELLYKNNNLLFCSETESLGLPLIEAMHYGCRILALNTPFANELLKNYNNKEFFLENDFFEKFQSFIKNNGESEGLNINDEPLLEVLKKYKIIN